MRTLALSVFSQCRRYLTHTSNIKALTGFGTAAMTELFLKNKDVCIISQSYFKSNYQFINYPCSVTGKKSNGVQGIYSSFHFSRL